MNQQRTIRTIALVAALAWLLAYPVSAGIRLDGSEFQSTSGETTTSTLKSATADQPKLIVYTAAQPIIADATIIGFSADKSGQSPTSATPARIGIGFGYNYLYTSICKCPCHGDPRCDGVGPDVLDVVKATDVAFRGAATETTQGPCHNENTDVNCSGETDILDVVRVSNVAFRGYDIATEFCNACAAD
jgi:hypothetical protein